MTRASRRRFVAGLGALGALAVAGTAWRHWPEQGFFNPCKGPLPRELEEHEVVQSAWDGLDARLAWDAHAHLAGTGDSGSGIVVSAAMRSVLNPAQFARRLFYLNAGCVDDAPGRADQSYVQRMGELVDGMRPGFKLLLFAFDANVGESGEVSWERTSFYVPDRYAAEVARRHPAHFEWAASIHPYRADCVERLQAAQRDGARAVKWLPAVMGIDPGSPRCDRFYEALARAGLPLISHAGLERALLAQGAQALGNPLRLRRALEHGVRVVVAHCASIGSDQDLDRGGAPVASFALFERMMDERRYVGRLFGDISAMTQLNRLGPPLARVIEREEWHARLLNGSDYPLPGVMPLYSVDEMVARGFLAAAAAPVLRRLREHNALLFDFVLKRHLRWKGRRFANRVFETRRFFEPGAAAK